MPPIPVVELEEVAFFAAWDPELHADSPYWESRGRYEVNPQHVGWVKSIRDGRHAAIWIHGQMINTRESYEEVKTKLGLVRGYSGLMSEEALDQALREGAG